MFSKTIRYSAIIILLVLMIAWILSFFYKRNESNNIKNILKSSKDSIEYAKLNIANAQHRIDSILTRIDSVNIIIAGINKKVITVNSKYDSILRNGKKEIENLKQQVLLEQFEMGNLKDQLKRLK